MYTYFYYTVFISEYFNYFSTLDTIVRRWMKFDSKKGQNMNAFTALFGIFSNEPLIKLFSWVIVFFSLNLVFGMG